jgi:hypothetical protein
MHETHVFLKPLDKGHRPIAVMVVGPARSKRIGESGVLFKKLL